MKAIVPIKGLARAKQRLSPLLTGAERQQLMTHMIDDVLSVICQSDVVSGLVVISDDEEVRAQALNYDARLLSEPEWTELDNKRPLGRPSGYRLSGIERLNQIFAMAIKKLAEEGEGSVLLLPADVPLITVNDLRQMAAQHNQPGVTLVPASVDGGTNAMMLSPPQLIEPGYGELSCRRHCDYAHAAGVEPQVLSLSTAARSMSDLSVWEGSVPEGSVLERPGVENSEPENSGSDFSGLRLDIDTVDDIHELMSMPLRCSTQQFLLDSEIMKRLNVNSVCLEPKGRKTA